MQKGFKRIWISWRIPIWKMLSNLNPNLHHGVTWFIKCYPIFPFSNHFHFFPLECQLYSLNTESTGHSLHPTPLCSLQRLILHYTAIVMGKCSPLKIGELKAAQRAAHHAPSMQKCCFYLGYFINPITFSGRAISAVDPPDADGKRLQNCFFWLPGQQPPPSAPPQSQDMSQSARHIVGS